MLYDIESTTFTRINYFGSHPLLTIVCYRKVLCIIDRCYLSNYFSLTKSQVFVLHLSPFFDQIRTTELFVIVTLFTWAFGQTFYLLAILSVSQPLQETLQQFILCCSVFYKTSLVWIQFMYYQNQKSVFFEKKQIKLFVAIAF